MKKTKMVKASYLVIFSLIFYSLSAVTFVVDTTLASDGYGDLEVIKEVFDNGAWSEGPIEASIGETLEFRITLTYYNTSGKPYFHYAYSIRVNDSLPECLDYVNGSANPYTNLIWSDDPDEYLYWDFGEQTPLFDNESLEIFYNATVVESNLSQIIQENNVTVLWNEFCTGGKNLESFDTLIINLGAEPQIKITKLVEGVKTYYADEGETLHFQINVSNTGPVGLTGLIVKDIYPDFITPLNSSIPMTIDDVNKTIIWEINNLLINHSIEILLMAKVNIIGVPTSGKNIANVTCDQNLTDEDYVTIIIEKPFIVDKKVWNSTSGEWAEHLSYVKKCEPVRFRINITYFGIDRMKCLLVKDTLPIECLNYSDNVFIEIAGNVTTPSDEDFYPDIYTQGETFLWCDNLVEVQEGEIYFSWINQSIGDGLENGESVIIEFDATVIEYCDDSEPCEMQNCVEAWLWSCCDCETVYYGEDCVDINCVALPGEFHKFVSLDDPTNWVKEVHTVQGFFVKFKLELTYYGNNNLTNVSFLDVLPCCLEYDSTIQSPTGTTIDVSGDKKTIWWNVSENVSDCETVSITFKAKVTGSNACGSCVNNGYVYGYFMCVGLVITGSDTAIIYAEPNSPPSAPDVSGPSEGIVGGSYSFKAMLSDPDGDQMDYKFDWGDGTTTDWINGPAGSGEVTQNHAYTTAKTYTIKAIARDEHGVESDWTQYPWTIVIKTASVELSLKMFNIYNVTAYVKNTGDIAISGLQWEFNISRDSLINFRDINVDGNGNIANLPIGGQETIFSSSTGLKIGWADVTVTASKTGVITPAVITARAFLIGPIILILE
jgi:uncharacterized repeat protein (TIGR01451 family)